jgi:repressor LexA
MHAPPTERQREIVEYLESEMRQRGMMPTQREIATRFGFASLNSVRSHLRLMENKGMIERLPNKARGLRLTRSSFGEIQLLGHIVAGQPQLAFQDTEEVVSVSPRMFRGPDLFALRVKGASMKDAGILPGDIAVLNRQQDIDDGEIAAVLLEDEATLKFLYRRQGTVVLRGANAAFRDIIVRKGESVCVLGKYVGLIRPHGGAA